MGSSSRKKWVPISSRKLETDFHDGTTAKKGVQHETYNGYDSRSQGTNQMRVGNEGVRIGNLPGFQNCNSEMRRTNASRSIRLDIEEDHHNLKSENVLGESFMKYAYAKKHILMVASVSEHWPRAWSSFMFDLHILLFLFPTGLYFCFKRLSGARIFIVVYGLTSMYFVGAIVRLILVTTPVAWFISAIAVSATIKNLIQLTSIKDQGCSYWFYQRYRWCLLKLPDTFSQLVSETKNRRYDAKTFASMLRAMMEKLERDIRDTASAIPKVWQVSEGECSHTRSCREP